ncbi:MAG TPA: TRAP transporter substrate-binding protein DctP [Bradyrhizobium sp.]|uniref:TRAP transporter substrate-binding protein DctP n=1 Tax=Bradyrhizobium sp. TaxID=376 RepID=UPI002D804345|nr:TRAP transporter substrate-binding protein DctP [Bradyrhizobium sp.]HET7889615.1 TRAP transporter substrate-binding protein DctP [Bradyrhizobium sp.]
MRNKISRRRFLRGAAAAGLMPGLSSRRAYPAVPPQVLRIGTTSARESQFGAGVAEFAAHVERHCGGRLRVEQYPAGEAGGELEMCQDVAAGTLDMTFASSAVFSALVPGLSIFDIPFLFRDIAHARGVMDSEIGQAALASFEPQGIIGLAWGENGLRHLTTSDRVVHRPEDLKNLKLRVPQSEVMVASFKAIGADVRSLPFPDLYAALSSGVFQAEENPIPTVLAANFDKVQRYLCLTGHVYSPAAFLMSKRVFERLSPEDRAALRGAGIAGSKASRAYVDRSEKSGVDELKRRGMQVVDDIDRPAFAASLASLESQFQKQFGKDKIDAIRAFGK